MLNRLLLAARELQNPKSYYHGLSNSVDQLPKELILFHRENHALHKSINRHHRFMLLICLSGEVHFHIDGKEISLKAGECTSILPYQFHRAEEVSANYDLLFITFEDRKNFFCHLNHLSAKLNNLQQQNLLTIIEAYSQSQSKMDIDYIILSVSSFIIELARTGTTADYYHSRDKIGTETLFHRILQIVRSHPTESPEIGEIAEQLSISKSYLRSQFRKYHRVSLGQFLLSARMNRAMSLFSTTVKSTSEVAYRCGYESVPSFCKAFKNYVDLTPSEFRKRFETDADWSDKTKK